MIRPINLLSLALMMMACYSPSQNKIKKSNATITKKEMKKEIVTFGGGCFWCIEAAFDQVAGVEKVISGYAGGNTKNPTYKEVCTGATGHAEVIQIHFNPSEISYNELLEMFWFLHDPTTLNRQGADVGTQYRSIILYNDEQQKEMAQQSLEKSEKSGLWNGKYTTQIVPLDKFYGAEGYHQDYYELNATQPYCSAVIAPKMEKFYKKFHDQLKPEYQ